LAKLFIYLPTYNRPNSLSKQLSALIPQVINLQKDVRVLISDNDSNKYEAGNLLQEFTHLDNVEIRQNGGNIGANANIALGFAFARPDEFLWILSDNDIIAPNAVSYILSLLDREVDFYCFINGIETVSEKEYNWQSGWQIPMEWRMGLISDALYNMESVRAVVEEAFYFHNSSFPHLAVACAAARKKGSSRFRLLPRQKISANEASSAEQPTDYSLAHVCMPLLVPLFPEWEARSFSRMWLMKHGIQLHLNKSKHPHLYIQSKSTLRHYGGWWAGVILWVTGLTAIVASPYLKNRHAIVSELKKHISSSCLKRAKSARRILCGK
jgi:glycosyltransferase involved in cell wall biosynthesis